MPKRTPDPAPGDDIPPTVTGVWTALDGSTLRGEYVTVAGMAQRLDMSPGNVLHHIKARHIPAVQTDTKRWLITPADADAAVAQYRPGKGRAWHPRMPREVQHQIDGTVTTDDGRRLRGTFLTVPGLAAQLAVPVKTIEYHIRQDNIAVVRTDRGRVLVRQGEVNRVTKHQRPNGRLHF